MKVSHVMLALFLSQSHNQSLPPCPIFNINPTRAHKCIIQPKNNSVIKGADFAKLPRSMTIPAKDAAMPNARNFPLY